MELALSWSGSSTSTSINATAGSVSGNIGVSANNSCGPGPAQSTNISVVIVPTNSYDTGINILNGQVNCYNAMQIITIAGSNSTFLIQNGGSATMIAGQYIDYLPGARVYSGGYMHGYISSNACCGVVPLAPGIVINPSNTDSLEKFTVNIPGSTYFKVYPNPTTGNFTLELHGDFVSSLTNVEIFGMRGEKNIHGSSYTSANS